MLIHAVRALRNAFYSPGRRLFGPRFSRDYLRIAWRAARAWGSAAPGAVDLLGHRLEYSNQSHALFLIHEIFVNGAYAFDSTNPRPCILDCGANIGTAVLFFKTLFPDARVIAFEPDPATFARLERTVATNGLGDVRLERAGVGGADGTATFYYDEADPGSITASVDPAWGGSTRREIRIVRLSSFVQSPIDFLKLDVEGAEYAVIGDLVETGAIDRIREAVIEYHEIESEPDALATMLKSLRNAGFDLSVAPAEGQRTGLVRARRPADVVIERSGHRGG